MCSVKGQTVNIVDLADKEITYSAVVAENN